MTSDPTRFLPPPAAANPVPHSPSDPPCSAPDPTEAVRRLLLEADQPHHDLVEAVMDGAPVWMTEEATAAFRFISFAAPFVLVERREDGARGTLEFTHFPRWYFNFVPVEEG